MPQLRFVFAAFFFLAASAPLTAQNDFLPGYVVTVEGDTLHGTVRDRDTGPFGGLERKVQLKPAQGRKKRFRRNQLSSYHRGDRRYIIAWFGPEDRPLSGRHSRQPGQGELTALVVVEEGPLSLYLYEFTDPDGSFIDHFPLVYLSGTSYFQRARQGVFGLKKKRLAEYLSDQPEVVAAMQAGTITTSRELVNAYNAAAARRP